MSKNTQQLIDRPMGWLRQVPGDIFKLDKRPLLGSPPPFPWKGFVDLLKKNLQISDLSITQGEIMWRSGQELFSTLGENVRCLTLSMIPLKGNLFFAIPEEKIADLIHVLLTKTPIEATQASDRDFLDTFYRFLAMEALNAFREVYSDKSLACSLAPGSKTPVDACLTIDVAISSGITKINGRLLLSQEFRQSWAQHHQNVNRLESPLAEALDVIAHLQVGRVKLKKSEWQSIVPGDFLVLDKCTLDPTEEKGRVLLLINEIPFFRAKLKRGSLKILEHPLHYEVDTDMDEAPKNNREDEDEDENLDADSEFGDDETNEHSEGYEDSDDTGEFDIESTESDEDGEESISNDDQAEDQENQELEAEDQENQELEAEEENLSDESGVANDHVEDSQDIRSLEDIPLPIVVEIGRLQMSIKELLKLQPGNMLELDTLPDSKVDLVVHGKKIGSGELLKVGDLLGVRITEVS